MDEKQKMLVQFVCVGMLGVACFFVSLGTTASAEQPVAELSIAQLAALKDDKDAQAKLAGKTIEVTGLLYKITFWHSKEVSEGEFPRSPSISIIDPQVSDVFVDFWCNKESDFEKLSYHKPATLRGNLKYIQTIGDGCLVYLSSGQLIAAEGSGLRELNGKLLNQGIASENAYKPFFKKEAFLIRGDVSKLLDDDRKFELTLESGQHVTVFSFLGREDLGVQSIGKKVAIAGTAELSGDGVMIRSSARIDKLFHSMSLGDSMSLGAMIGTEEVLGQSAHVGKTESVPKESKIVIVKAKFGVGKKWVDVTERMREIYATESGSFWNRPGGLQVKDPAKGNTKKTVIHYTIDGVQKQKSISSKKNGTYNLHHLLR